MTDLQRENFHKAVDVIEMPPRLRKRDGRIFRGAQLEIGGHIYRCIRVHNASYRIELEYLGPMITPVLKDEKPAAKTEGPSCDGGKCA